MIDKLVLRCQFKDPSEWSKQVDIYDVLDKSEKGISRLAKEANSWRWRDFDLRSLGIPLEGEINVCDGSVSNLRHRWESIPSTFHNVGFRLFFNPANVICDYPYVEINASPAYLNQGHNVFGSLDLADCALKVMEPFLSAYPDLANMLDFLTWEVVEIHLTFASFARDQRESEQFIHALKNLARGHTKARSGFATTAYFGSPKSKYKGIRVYLKQLEMIHKIKELTKQGDNKKLAVYDKKLMEWCNGMIRFEAMIKKRWLERRDIPTNLIELCKIWTTKLAIDLWKQANADLINILSGHEMKIVTDEKVLASLKLRFGKINQRTGKLSYTRADTAYRSFRFIKNEGYEQWHNLTSSSTRSRHLHDLLEVGISQAYLQQYRGDGLGHVVVPMVRYIHIDFGSQYPDWAIAC